MGPTSSFSLHEAAAELDLHYMTVYRHVRNGRLPATRTSSGWEVSATDLATYACGDRPDRDDRRRHFEERLIAHDDAALWRVVQGEMASGNSAADILQELIVPSLASIGARWQHGELTVLDEHQATAAAAVVVARLGPHIRRIADATRAKSGADGDPEFVVVGAPSGDTHQLAPSIVSDLLRAGGFETIELGADTPAESFAEVVNECAADGTVAAVAISVHVDIEDSSSEAHHNVKDTIAAIRATGTNATVFVGGAGAHGVDAATMGCDYVTSDIDRMLELISS